MAEQEFSPNPIRSLTDDWSKDTLDVLQRPFGGGAVQTFIKSYLRDMLASGQMVDNNINFYNADGEVVFQVPISSTLYFLTITSNLPSYVLDSVTSYDVTYSYVSESSPLGSEERTPVIEGSVAYSLQVDNGSGYREVLSGTILSGSTGSVTLNIRPYLTSGVNSLKMVMTGATSNKTSFLTQNVNLTSFYLNSSFSYYIPWLGTDSTYFLNNLYFYGAFNKSLVVTLKGDDYEESSSVSFSPTVNYQSSPYRLDIASLFAPEDSGVYELSFYMTGGGQVTKTYTYSIIYVAAEEIGLVSLCAVNNVGSVKNYSESRAFDVIGYGKPSVSIAQYFNPGGVIIPLGTRTLNLTENQATEFIVALSEDTEAQSATYTASVSIQSGNTVGVTVPVDLSESYIPIPGYSFYLKPSSQSNADSNRNTLLNQANHQYVPATFTNFAFCNDGWVTHSGRSALLVRSGESITTSFVPFGSLVSNGCTFEMLFSVENISNYSGSLFNALAGTLGMNATNSQFTVKCEAAQDAVHQGFSIPEGEMMHVVVSVLPSYRASAYNLCQIYVNGIAIVSFQYNTGSSFGSAPLVFNPSSSDLYIYALRMYPQALDSDQVYQNLLNVATN